MSESTRIFGTDGIRDRAGIGFLEPAQVRRVVRATAASLPDRAKFPRDFPQDVVPATARTIVLGRDTRASGEWLADLIGETFCTLGYHVVDVGVIPTPGVAHTVSRRDDGVLGVMISASHNPAEYNGIKFLAPTGAKVSPAFEDEVSAAFWNDRRPPSLADGGLERAPRLVDDYVRWLVSLSHHPHGLRGRRVVLDSANGATSGVAARVFEALGASVIAVADRPDGENINRDCGALHPDGLARRVIEEGAFAGFAFDGDGDRMIPVSETGQVLDGDFTLAITARYLMGRGELPTRTVVATVMSNLGLEKATVECGLRLLRTPVGDRHVYEVMRDAGHVLGGEQSGHTIFLADALTGDGLLAALRLVDSLEIEGWSLERSSRIMRRYPQILLNYRVSEKIPLEDLPAVQAAVREAEVALAGDGRIVLRYSGTEPLARVMIEGPESGLIGQLAERIGQAVVESVDAGAS